MASIIIIQMRNLKLKEVKEPFKVRQTPGVNGELGFKPRWVQIGSWALHGHI